VTGDGKFSVRIFVEDSGLSSCVTPLCQREGIIGETVDGDRETISHHLTVARPGKGTTGQSWPLLSQDEVAEECGTS
jgi:hypothetical protein